MAIWVGHVISPIKPRERFRVFARLPNNARIKLCGSKRV